MAAKIITKDNFDEEILNYNGKALVDFWAEWCGPCKMLSPVIDGIAEELESVKICKVNCDNDRDLAISFGINAIPCLLLFENGKLIDKAVGIVEKDEVMKFIIR